MSWVMKPDPRCSAPPPSAPPSGLDPGDGAVAVICDPNRFAADRDGARFGADPDRVAFVFSGVEVDLADRVGGRVSDPDDAGAGVDAAGLAADVDLSPYFAQRGVDLGHRPPRWVGDPDGPAGDGDAGRARPREDRGPRVE